MIHNLSFHVGKAGRYTVADSWILPNQRAALTVRDGMFMYAYLFKNYARASTFRGCSELDVIQGLLFSDLARDIQRNTPIVVDDATVLQELMALHCAWLNPGPVRAVQAAYETRLLEDAREQLRRIGEGVRRMGEASRASAEGDAQVPSPLLMKD